MEPQRPEPETLALRALQSAMTDASAALGRRMRMHPTDLAAMEYLSRAQEPVGPGDLAHLLGLSPAAATELVDRLTLAGHVERRRDLVDRRRIRLEPTSEASTTVMAHLGVLLNALNSVAAESSEEERATILRFLRRVTETYADWADPARD